MPILTCPKSTKIDKNWFLPIFVNVIFMKQINFWLCRTHFLITMIESYFQQIHVLIWNWLTKLMKIDKNEPKSTTMRNFQDVSRHLAGCNETFRARRQIRPVAKHPARRLVFFCDTFCVMSKVFCWEGSHSNSFWHV